MVDNKKIQELTERIEILEKTIREFMSKWGPEVQARRDKRDEVWDEMVKVVSIQNKHKGKLNEAYSFFCN